MWTDPKPLFSNIPVPVAVFSLGIVSSVERDTQVIFSCALNKFLCDLHYLYLSNITAQHSLRAFTGRLHTMAWYNYHRFPTSWITWINRPSEKKWSKYKELAKNYRSDQTNSINWNSVVRACCLVPQSASSCIWSCSYLISYTLFSREKVSLINAYILIFIFVERKSDIFAVYVIVSCKFDLQKLCL